VELAFCWVHQRIKYNPEEFLFKEYDRKLRRLLNEIYSLIIGESNHQAERAIGGIILFGLEN
jgi:dolichol kinase